MQSKRLAARREQFVDGHRNATFLLERISVRRL
jgi:hypothetical protein